MVEHVSGLRHEMYPKSRATRNKVENTQGRPRHLKATKSQHRGRGLRRSAEKPFEDAWAGLWQMDQKERPVQFCTRVVLLATVAGAHPTFIGCSFITKVLWFPPSSPSYSSPHPCLTFSCLLLLFLPSIPTHNLINHTLNWRTAAWPGSEQNADSGVRAAARTTQEQKPLQPLEEEQMGKEHQRHQHYQGHTESRRGSPNVSQMPDGLEEQAAAEVFLEGREWLWTKVAICGSFRRYRSTALCSSAKGMRWTARSSKVLDHLL